MTSQRPPETMRAITLPPPPYDPSKPPPPASLEYLSSHPVPISQSCYTVKVSYSALTRGELSWSETLSPERKSASIPGHDVCGTIVSVPSSSPMPTKFNLGDEVFALVSFSRDGAAAEYTLAGEEELAIRPKNISSQDASTIPLSALSAWQALFEHGGLPELTLTTDNASHGPAASTTTPAPMARKILITGASGGVGVMAVQIAKASASATTVPSTVVGTCSHRNVDFVKSLGADAVIDYTAFPTLADGVIGLGMAAGEQGAFDMILDTVGGHTLEECCSSNLIRDGGRVVSVAMPLSEERKQQLGIAERGVKCIFFVVRPDGAQLQTVAGLVEAGQVTGVVDSVWDLDHGKEAMEKVEGGRCRGKVVLKVR